MEPEFSHLQPLRCELCGGQMKLVRELPRSGAEPQLATYQCLHCRRLVTRPVEQEHR